MSYNPYARYRYGGELYHGRTKGSKNGVSNTPGYKAVGRKAVGRIIGYQNGRPIYAYTDTGTGTPDPRSTAAKQKTLLGRVGLLAGRVGNTVSRAAGTVGRTVSGAANQAVKTVKKTARNAYNAVGNAWDGKAGKGTAKDLARLSRNPERENARYNRSIRGRLESAGRAISGAGRSAGNWLTGRANDVGKAARGVGRAIDKAWDGKAGKGSAKDDAAAYNKYANDLRALQSGSRSLKTRQAYVRAANRASSAYDNSIKGRLESAGRSISKAAGNAGNWLNDRRRDVGNAARNAGRAIDRAWDGRVGRGDARDTAYEYDLQGRETDAARSREAYNRSIKGRLENLPGNIGRAVSGAARSAAGAVGGAANRARRAVEEAWDGKAGKGSAKDDAYEYFRQGEDGTDREGFREMDRYNRSIKGRLENAGKAISKAGRNASRFVSDRAEDVSKAARGAANAVGSAARDAGKFVSDRAGDVRRTVRKAGQAIDEAWDGKVGKGSAKDDAAKYRQRGLSGKDPNMKKIDFELGDRAAKKYSKSVKGQIENAPKNIGKAVNGIGEKISGAAGSASKKVSETASKAAKNLNTQVGKVTSEINRVKDSVSAGANYDKIQKDYQNMYVQYRQLQMRDPKAAKAMEPQMNDMSKAYLEMQRNYNGSSLGKVSRDATDFVSSVTGSKRKEK